MDLDDEGTSAVDIGLVRRNAQAQGVVLQTIALLYVGLSEEQKSMLRELNLLKLETENCVIATFTESGEALFPEKITGVEYLAAD